MLPILFDRDLLRRRRARALQNPVPGADFLLTLAAEDIAERLATVSRSFERALCISPTGDALALAVKRSGRAASVHRADVLVRGADGAHPADSVIDDEALPFQPESFDLVVSTLSLQFANDLPGALIQIRRALKPDGLFLGLLVGGDSLHELRAAFLAADAEDPRGASPRIAPFADVRDLGGLLQRAGFALPVTDVDRLTLRYATPLHLMAELRAMGATNCLTDRSRQPLLKRHLQEAIRVYAEDHADADGRIRATLALVSLSGWAPHESQQKALKPGSAKMRLADALKAAEHSAGDKAGS